jgi:hypothetical protein
VFAGRAIHRLEKRLQRLLQQDPLPLLRFLRRDRDDWRRGEGAGVGGGRGGERKRRRSACSEDVCEGAALADCETGAPHLREELRASGLEASRAGGAWRE